MTYPDNTPIKIGDVLAIEMPQCIHLDIILTITNTKDTAIFVNVDASYDALSVPRFYLEGYEYESDLYSLSMPETSGGVYKIGNIYEAYSFTPKCTCPILSLCNLGCTCGGA